MDVRPEIYRAGHVIKRVRAKPFLAEPLTTYPQWYTAWGLVFTGPLFLLFFSSSLSHRHLGPVQVGKVLYLGLVFGGSVSVGVTAPSDIFQRKRH